MHTLSHNNVTLGSTSYITGWYIGQVSLSAMNNYNANVKSKSVASFGSCYYYGDGSYVGCVVPMGDKVHVGGCLSGRWYVTLYMLYYDS